MTPILLMEVTKSDAEHKYTINSLIDSSLKPSTESDKFNLQNFDEKTNTKGHATITTTQSATTSKHTIQKPTSLIETAVVVDNSSTQQKLTTTTTATVNNQQDNNIEFPAESKSTTIATTAVTTIKPISTTTEDYDDYLDYEDAIKADRQSINSLWKVNEPVCYMIKYQANNTIFTNRGCINFINDNKYLTCQSLYNGAPLSSCRICSTNGCNKFSDDDNDEESHGIFVNDAAPPEGFNVLLLFVCCIFELFMF